MDHISLSNKLLFRDPKWSNSLKLPSDGILLQCHKKHYFAPNQESGVISNDIHKHISPNPEHFLQPHKTSPQ